MRLARHKWRNAEEQTPWQERKSKVQRIARGGQAAQEREGADPARHSICQRLRVLVFLAILIKNISDDMVSYEIQWRTSSGSTRCFPRPRPRGTCLPRNAASPRRVAHVSAHAHSGRAYSVAHAGWLVRGVFQQSIPDRNGDHGGAVVCGSADRPDHQGSGRQSAGAGVRKAKEGK